MKVEKFAENFLSDSTILRMTAYEHYSYEDPTKILNIFSGRIDFMVKRALNCKTEKVHEYFDLGRNDYLKSEWRYSTTSGPSE